VPFCVLYSRVCEGALIVSREWSSPPSDIVDSGLIGLLMCAVFFQRFICC